MLDGIQRGREAAQADRLHDAERCFLDALDASRGTFTEAELLACSSLVTLYSRENREFEALLMARRLDPIAVRRGELWHIAHARGAVCSALVGMQDWVRVKTALRGLEEVVAAVPEEKRAGHLVCLHGLRMEVLLQHREAGGARDLWNAAEPAFRRAES
ncbi:MAG: hypothetical protein OER88_12690, partial [Planctomycetota bacterium]|nr:hypothetical protein [Planctomycetota bacterium]